jgi:hypothetical protein
MCGPWGRFIKRSLSSPLAQEYADIPSMVDPGLYLKINVFSHHMTITINDHYFLGNNSGNSSSGALTLLIFPLR